MSKYVVGSFESASSAEAAIRALIDGGVPSESISMLATDFATENRVHGFVTRADVTRTGASSGAWVGGIFGLLGGAAFVWSRVSARS